MKKILIILTAFFLLGPATSTHASPKFNCKDLEKVFQTKVETENGVCKVEIVRTNLNASMMNKKVSPETMELVFHFSFENVNGQTMLMGEFALLEEEVNPVIDEFRKGKLEVTALHNHMLMEQPRILYLHFQSLGDMEKQANTLKKAIEKTTQKL